ncbi:MAG TPA: choice-of-anchor D domain-containing protein [Blastocatellia bacterium]|nr:choice-of-anchor D domain-containing protein [Blastocatellia bacterium]
MNTLTRSARLCVLLLFCFGLQVSEVLQTRKTFASDRTGHQASSIVSAPAGSEELFTDNGTSEAAIGGNGLLCVNRLTPTVYPATLQTVRIFFLALPDSPAGAQINLIAFAGAQGATQPPGNPTLLLNQPVTIPTVPPAGGFIDFPIQNGPTIASGDIYVGFQAPNPTGAVRFTGDINGQQQQRSFISFNSGQTFQSLLLSGSTPVNLMVRAIVVNSTGAAPRIESPATLNFGFANPGSTSERTLMARNGGDAPLNITGVTSNDQQFTALSFTPPLTIAPGGQAPIALRFAPAGLGAQNAALTIASDDPIRPSLNIMVSGVGGQPSTTRTLFTNSGAAQTGSINAPSSGIALYRPEFAIFVPAGATELKIDLNGNQNMDLAARFNQLVFPFDGSPSLQEHRSNNPGVAPESISITPSTTPPLRSGLYYIAILNVGPGAANFNLTATVTGGTAPGLATSVSAASFSGPQLASEAIAAAYGSGLATSTQFASSQPLPTDLAGTTIKIRDNSGIERLAPLFFVSPLQANFQVAPGTASGGAFLTFTSGDGKISTGTAEIVSVAPGIFAANADGQGVPAAVVCRADDPTLQSCRSVARLDSTLNRFVPAPINLGTANDQFFLLLFGSGIRGRSSLSAVTATIGGTPVMLGFAGPQGSFTGLDQLNVGPLPRSLAGRGMLDVVITVDGKVANTVKINIE